MCFFSRSSGQDARWSKQIWAHVQAGQSEKVTDDAPATNGRADVAWRCRHVGSNQQPSPIRHVGRRRGNAGPILKLEHHIHGVQFAHQTRNTDSSGEKLIFFISPTLCFNDTFVQVNMCCFFAQNIKLLVNTVS